LLRKVISFGFRHEGGGPNAGNGVLVVDVRKMFRNPYQNRALRSLRGTDKAVQDEILKTPNFTPLYQHLLRKVSAPGIEVAYIGCTGGHHRSVFLAEKLAHDLGVPVEHRDIEKP
jgi:RNase adapter protein RapZ